MPQSVNETRNAATGEVTVSIVPWDFAAFSRRIKELRQEREIAGITVGGVPISTERGDHRIVMQQLLLSASSNPEFLIRLKVAESQFVTLNQSQTIACCQAMLGYIQSCFAVEDDALQAAEMATTDEDFEAILTGLVWPSQVYS